ncbi:MAG: hypothetical protein EBR23_09325, partial [Planctomycetia bacterium]|nr:hypothetical protein [Planctomycetia bacterium]
MARSLLVLLAWHAAIPCRSLAQSWLPAATESRGPQKLLEWQAGPGVAGEEDLYAGRIITDRPHIAEAASTVGLGRVQVENGYTYYLDGAAGTTSQLHSFPETLVRVGLFREWFEFRAGYNYFVVDTNSPSGGGVARGSDDLYLGAKLALADQAGILPELT